MLKAVTRQATSVDAKIRALNDGAAIAGGAEGNVVAGGRAPMSTAYFFDHHATAEDVEVVVTERDFLAAHAELVPSVSRGELEHYERVRAAFEGGRVEAGRNGDEAVPGHGIGNGTARPAMGSDSRVVSNSSIGSRGSGKGKGKAVAGAGKGKGKAVAMGDSDGEYGGYEDEGEAPGPRSKGKGKAVAEFHEGTASDDDSLY